LFNFECVKNIFNTEPELLKDLPHVDFVEKVFGRAKHFVKDIVELFF
jgi:hypothetical protein